MGAWPQKPAQIHADSERVAVELQRNAAAKVEFEIQVADRFVIDPRVVAVVTDQVRTAGGNAGSGEACAVFCGAARATLRGGAAAEDPADQCLIAPRRDVVGRDRKAELAWVVLDAAVELRVITVGHEWTMKKLCIHDRVADSGVQER